MRLQIYRFNVPARALQLVLVLMATLLFAPLAAHADFVLYCTGGNTCSTTYTGLGSPSSYYQVTDTNTITGTTSGTFDIQLGFQAFGFTGNSAGFLQSFSLTLFPNTDTLSNLAFDGGESNGWTDLQNLKSDNGGTCKGKVKGAVCTTSKGSTEILLTPTATTFGISGDYSGGAALSSIVFLANATTNQDGSGGNTLAISQDASSIQTTPFTPVPEPASLTLLGTGLAGLATMMRRRRKPSTR